MLPRYNQEIAYEIGIDESGRGPLFGRVYAAAVVLPTDPDAFAHDRMCDSKRIKSPKKMADLAAYIHAHAIASSVQYVEHDVIDRINILQADMQAMHACVRDILGQIDPSKSISILVDGNYFKPGGVHLGQARSRPVDRPDVSRTPRTDRALRPRHQQGVWDQAVLGRHR
jgi:ribonuclease HII